MRGRRWNDVLNAFRHHRQDHARAYAWDVAGIACSTPFGITDKITTRRPSDSSGSVTCSTPFGITDKITLALLGGQPLAHVLNAFRHHRQDHERELQRDRHLRHVLNAFRHHRQDHWSSESRPRPSRVCSTPFGITDKITPASRRRRSLIACSAQRLSASQTRSRPGNAGKARDWPMCSTPFGITDKITPPEDLHHLPAASAQRLSASQTRSQVGAWGRPQAMECSTPFGITDKITRRQMSGHPSAAACSTPFGITDKITPGGLQQYRPPDHVLNAFRHHRQDHFSLGFEAQVGQ